MKRNNDNPAQLLMFGEIVPDGDGGFHVRARKPVFEVDAERAAQVLGVSRSSLTRILNEPMAQRMIQWRWTSERCGKRLFDLASVHAYREACRDADLRDSRTQVGEDH